MGAMIKLGIKIDGIDSFVRRMSERERDLNKATSMAANKTLPKARTEAVNAITDIYNINKKDVRSRIRMRKARPGNLDAWLDPFAGSRRMSFNIIRMVTNKATAGKMRKRGGRTPLRVRILKGHRPKVLKGAFIGNDGRTVFRRIGKSRLPIKPVQTIGVPQAFGQRRIRSRIIERIRREYPVEWKRAWRLLEERRR